jgi:hypothetical protein
MKQNKNILLTALCCLLLSWTANAQSHVTMSLANATSTANAFEFDVFIVNDGTTALNLGGYQFGLNFNLGIMNGGTGLYNMVPGTRDAIFSALAGTSDTFQNSQLKAAVVTSSPGAPLVTGVSYRLGRFQFQNSVNWTPGSMPNLSFQTTVAGGKTVSIAQCFVNGGSPSTSLTVAATTLSVASSINSLTLNIPLPVNLLSFTGVREGNTHNLTWITDMEKHNAYFNLHHSTDGVHFTTLDKIYSQAENGNSNVALTYHYTHREPTLGHNYYRLEQVDIDGQSTIESKTIDILMDENNQISIYPNPASDKLQLLFDDVKASRMELNIIDQLGRKMMSHSIITKAGTNQFTLPLQSLAEGMYFVQLLENKSVVAHLPFVKK